MSDILKRIGFGGKPEPDSPRQEDRPVSFPGEGSARGVSGGDEAGSAEKKSVANGIKISKVMIGGEGTAGNEGKMGISEVVRHTQLDATDSQRLYGRGLELMKVLINRVRRSEQLDLKDVCALVEDIVHRLLLGDNELLSLTISYSPDNYLITHSLNVTILSVEIGLGKGYNTSRLNELGLCAFLYDIGMAGVIDLANKPRTLSKDEYARIKEHPLRSEEILKRIEGINQAVLDVARQHHERLKGQGYPLGLKNGQIGEYARVVALCDVYEALIHPRPYRPKLDSHEAIKQILTMNSEGHFEAQNVKIMIKKLGIFPVGSWVELNTGETGKVVSANEDYPLRPNVNVIFNLNRQRYPQAKMTVLAEQQSIYIKRAVDLQDLGLSS